ncbi:MAG TPA: DUF3891 family protein [Mucilaginibacter sp.]|nr:DUF3891 family protein [Mucilaginibacter sp.]
MIVNYTEPGWEIITQRAHGLLAAEIAVHWSHAIRTARWTETLLAIAEHDDAQVEIEKEDLLTEQGGPVDFKMKHFEHGHCDRTMQASLSKSRCIALLCSMHLEFVFGKYPSSARFIKEQVMQRKRWRKELGISLAQAQKDYNLLEWCDALSLLLCQRENQPEEREIEVSQGYRMTQPGENLLTIDPWPFEEKHFDLAFEYRLIPQLRFKSSAEFRKAFLDAPVKLKKWQMRNNLY